VRHRVPSCSERAIPTLACHRTRLTAVTAYGRQGRDTALTASAAIAVC